MRTRVRLARTARSIRSAPGPRSLLPTCAWVRRMTQPVSYGTDQVGRFSEDDLFGNVFVGGCAGRPATDRTEEVHMAAWLSIWDILPLVAGIALISGILGVRNATSWIARARHSAGARLACAAVGAALIWNAVGPSQAQIHFAFFTSTVGSEKAAALSPATPELGQAIVRASCEGGSCLVRSADTLLALRSKR